MTPVILLPWWLAVPVAIVYFCFWAIWALCVVLGRLVIAAGAWTWEALERRRRPPTVHVRVEHQDAATENIERAAERLREAHGG